MESKHPRAAGRRAALCAALLLGASGATLATAGPASAVATTPPGTYAYVITGDQVSVIDIGSDSVRATVPVGDGPRGLAIDRADTHVYVANASSASVSVIDTWTNTVTATIALAGSVPRAIAVTPDGGRVYVADGANNVVSVIDTATNAVTATISVGSHPERMAMAPDGRHVYVSNISGGSVSVIDTATNSVTAEIPVEIPDGLQVSPDGTRVYVASELSVGVVDTATNSVSSIVATGESPYGVAVSGDGAHAYVTTHDNRDGVAIHDLRIIDTATNTITATYPVGLDPYGIAVTPDDNRAYVANTGESDLYDVDLATGTHTTVPVSAAPLDVVIGTIPQPKPTALRAGTATLSVLPLGVAGLKATLTSSGTPLPGQTIAFTATDGTPLCTAVTGADGRATCNSAPGLPTTLGVLCKGYTATLAATRDYVGATAHGATRLL